MLASIDTGTALDIRLADDSVLLERHGEKHLGRVQHPTRHDVWPRKGPGLSVRAA